MKCPICLSNFPINLLELSHDIPLYIGGTDKDGRRHLCVRCHDIYENIILFRCIREILNEGNLPRTLQRGNRTYYMNKINRLCPERKNQCRKIAFEIKERFFDKEDDTQTITKR